MGLRDLACRVGAAYQRRPDRHPQVPGRVDVGGPDQDRRVQGLRAARVPADQRQRARVVAAPAVLVPLDDPAGVLHRRAGHRRREHRLPQHLPHVQRGPAAQLVLGVREVRHLPQPGPDDDPAPVADGAHHLQLLVDHHRQLLDLLAVGEEAEQVLRGRPLGGIAVRPADRVHDHRAAAHPDVHLRARPDQRPVPGVHQEGPVRAPLAGQQVPEQRQRAGPAEPREHAPVGPPDHEVGALAPPDLLPQHPPDDLLVLLVADVEAPALDPDRAVRELLQGGGERDLVPLLGGQGEQRGAVVADVEAALADLAERDQRQALAGQRGEPVVPGHRAEQHLHRVPVPAGGAAAQQGEGAGVVEQVEQVHRSGSFREHCGGRRDDPGRGTPKAASRAAFAKSGYAQSAGRRRSGPPPVLGRVREHARHGTRPGRRADGACLTQWASWWTP
ncbi:hypothetical protein SFUMM280S_07644 [Streptomyces fumanus]